MRKRLDQTRGVVLGVAIAVASATGAGLREGHTGTYGSIDDTYDGFAISIDTSVGSMSDHQAEAPAHAAANLRAKDYLARHRSQLLQISKHYRTGRHPYQRLRTLLQNGKPEETERSLRMELVLPDPQSSAGPPLRIEMNRHPQLTVLASPQLPLPWRQKLAADLALSQLAPGGIFASPQLTGYSRQTPREAQEFLGALVNSTMAQLPQDQIFRIVEAVRSNQAHLQPLAQNKSPIPAAQEWSQALALSGWFLAKALHYVLDQKPYGEDLWLALGSLPAQQVPRAAQILVLLLPDAQWTSGLVAVREHVKPAAASELAGWLDTLSKPPAL